MCSFLWRYLKLCITKNKNNSLIGSESFHLLQFKMPALWDKLSLKMLTKKGNMHHPRCAPQFFHVIIHIWGMWLSYTPFESPPHSTFGLKGNFQGWEMKGLGHGETETLPDHHWPFMLVLSLALVPSSPMHLSTQFSRNSMVSLLPFFPKGTQELFVIYI